MSLTRSWEPYIRSDKRSVLVQAYYEWTGEAPKEPLPDLVITVIKEAMQDGESPAEIANNLSLDLTLVRSVTDQ